MGIAVVVVVETIRATVTGSGYEQVAVAVRLAYGVEPGVEAPPPAQELLLILTPR